MGSDTGTTRRFAEAQALAAFAVGAGVFLLLQLGYRFEALDQLQYLLLPYRHVFERFLPGDWFTWKTTHYHHSYSAIVRVLAALSGPRLAEAMFGAHVAVLCWLGFSIARLSRAAGLGWAGALSALVVTGLIREAGVAGATLNHGQLIPADLALPPLLLAIAAWFEARPGRVGVWLGVSGLVHANFAVLGPLTMAPLLLWQTPRAHWLPMARTVGLPLFAVAAPSFVLIALGFFAKDAAPDALTILFHVRSPHHYEVSAMPPDDLWWPLLLCAACLPGLWQRQRARAPGARQMAGLLVVIVAVVSLSLVGSLVESAGLIRLFTFRMSVPLILLLAMALGADTRAALARRDWAGIGLSLSAWAALACFARDDVVQAAGSRTGAALFALAPTLGLVSAGVSQVLKRFAVLRLGAIVPLGWAVLVAQVPLETELHGKKLVEAEHRGPRLSELVIRPELKPLHELVRKSTPDDARFLIPPSLIDFRLMARRAVFVDWKCAPMRGDELLEWKRRMLAVLGTTEFPFTGYALRKGTDAMYEARSPAVLLALARSEGLTHAVLPRRSRNVNRQGGDFIGREGSWSVYRVLSPSEWEARKRTLTRRR